MLFILLRSFTVTRNACSNMVFLASYKPGTLDFYYSICFSTPLFCTIGLEVKKHEKSNLQ